MEIVAIICHDVCGRRGASVYEELRVHVVRSSDSTVWCCACMGVGAAAANTSSQPHTPRAVAESLVSSLQTLSDLHRRGDLTAAELASAKKQLLVT